VTIYIYLNYIHIDLYCEILIFDPYKIVFCNLRLVDWWFECVFFIESTVLTFQNFHNQLVLVLNFFRFLYNRLVLGSSFLIRNWPVLRVWNIKKVISLGRFFERKKNWLVT
jgi:hypothetical protein